MSEIELRPTIENCIETTARRRYEEATSSLLAGQTDAPQDVMAELELLYAFLTTADFRELRAASERQLQQGRDLVFRLRGTGPDFTCRMEIL